MPPVPTNLLDRLIYHKISITMVALLISYVIYVSYWFINNPYSWVTSFASIVNVRVLIYSTILFFFALRPSGDNNDITFEIIKNIIVFITFVLFSFIFWYYNPGGYIMSYVSFYVYGLIFIFAIFGILYLMLYYYTLNKKDNAALTEAQLDEFDKNKKLIVTMLKYFLLISFSIGFFIILILFIQNTMSNYGSSNYATVAMNIIIVIIVAALVYKIITAAKLYKESPLIQAIINTIFYIPCLFVNLIDIVVKLYGIPTKTEYILLGAAIILNTGYFIYPYIANNFSKQGGKSLINDPIYTSRETTLGSYQSLNDSEDFKYTYAISFWVYIDSATPSMNNASINYTSILNYGNKPNILYRTSDNTLMVTMENYQPISVKTKVITNIKNMIMDTDENGNRIIYIKKDVLLQKWNNIIINYTGGTLDIFYNGVLEKSAIEVVPYMKYNTLTVGSKNGIHGGVCNVNYFNKSLNIQQIYYLYNFVKDNNPPIYKSSNNSNTDTSNITSIMNKQSIDNYGNALKSKLI